MKKQIQRHKGWDGGRGIEITIFFLVAYGLNFLIGIPLMSNQNLEPNIYGGFMMILPANAVFFAKLYKDKSCLEQNRVLHTTLLGLSLIYFLMMCLRIFGVLNYKTAYWILETFTVICSIGIIVNVWFKKNGKGLFFNFELVHKEIFIFALLLIGKGVLNFLPYPENYSQGMFGVIYGIVGIPIVFLLNAVRYFGEEYGWRGYLQEKMQKRFGKRQGVIILGVVWELWHLPLWFTAYDLEIWELPFRFAGTIGMAIFLGYLYMKTKNIWICVLAHSINNTLAGIIVQNVHGDSKNAIYHAIIILVFSFILSLFIFKKEYKTM